MKKNWVSPPTREARRLRAAMTPDAKHLWTRLRRRQLAGFRFRREHPLGPYFVDFYCHRAKVAIEVDGAIHEEPETAEYDRLRTNYLRGIGVTLLRFTNKEVRFSIESVLYRIRTVLRRRTSVVR